MKTLVFLIMTSMLPITLGYQTTAGAPIVTVKISDDLKVDKSYQGAVEVKVKKSNGQPVANKLVEVSAVTNTATLISKRALTNSKGIATFDLNTGAASGVFSLKATIDGKEYDSNEVHVQKPEVMVKSKKQIILVVADELIINDKHANAVIVKVLGDNGVGLAGAEVVAMITSKTATLPETKATTDESGDASFTIQAGKDPGSFFITVSVEDLGLSASDEGDVIQGRANSFNSKRVVSNLFLGYTVTNDYQPVKDEDGNDIFIGNDGKPLDHEDLENGMPKEGVIGFRQFESKGFQRTGFVGALDVDTLWYWRTQRNGENDPTYKGTQIHTGVFMQFAQFPVAEIPDDVNPNVPTSFSDFADSFTGRLQFSVMPASWSSYSMSTRSNKPEHKYDAFRFGIFLKGGFTTRDLLEEFNNQDHAIARYSTGIRFTHHQTAAESAAKDLDNVTPLRFVEIGYERIEEFGTELDWADRIVVDAVLRLPGIGNDTIPFHAGIHANMGEGPDDVRLFVGFDFKLDKLAAILKQ